MSDTMLAGLWLRLTAGDQAHIQRTAAVLGASARIVAHDDDELACWETMQDTFAPHQQQLHRHAQTLAKNLHSVEACRELVATNAAQLALIAELRNAWPHPGQGCIGLGLISDHVHAHNLTATARGLVHHQEHRTQHLQMLEQLPASDQPASASAYTPTAAAAISSLAEPDRPPGCDQHAEQSPIPRKRRAAITGCAAAAAPPNTFSVERLLNTG